MQPNKAFLPKSLIVVCDANAEVGYGHFFRCLHLVNALVARMPAIEVTWTGSLESKLLPLIESAQSADMVSTSLNPNLSLAHPQASYKRASNAQTAIRECLCLPQTWLLIDSYLPSEGELDEAAKRHHLVAIDDFAKTTYASAQAVLNFCVSAPHYDYRAANLLLGTEFFLCDPRLNATREKKLSANFESSNVQHNNKRILIAMGGFDRFSVGAQIALALHELAPNTEITLLGASQQPLPSPIKHLTRSDNMPALYAKADCVISGGGLIKYESAFCATVNIAVSQTQEQLLESQAFAKNKLCLSYGLAQDWHKESFIRWYSAIDWTAQRACVATASKTHFVTHSTEHAANALALLIEEEVD